MTHGSPAFEKILESSKDPLILEDINSGDAQRRQQGFLRMFMDAGRQMSSQHGASRLHTEEWVPTNEEACIRGVEHFTAAVCTPDRAGKFWVPDSILPQPKSCQRCLTPTLRRCVTCKRRAYCSDACEAYYRKQHTGKQCDEEKARYELQIYKCPQLRVRPDEKQKQLTSKVIKYTTKF